MVEHGSVRRFLIAAVLIADAGATTHSHTSKLSEAQASFLNARYETTAELALELRLTDPENLAAIELRSTALLFQLKDLLPERGDKDKALKECARCRELLTDFLSETTRGQTVARAILKTAPGDEAALFLLGKIDLNYVWLQLGPLSRKTGWDEYWEARHSLDAVLAKNPTHVRAQVARAWVDYVVDTKMPWGTKWLLGGGNRKRALTSMQTAAAAQADVFEHAEARFALWDLYRRERRLAEAVTVAEELARDFPDNTELTEFLGKHKTDARR
jgi:tetratricopeptide (TPR) repeat protein